MLNKKSLIIFIILVIATLGLWQWSSQSKQTTVNLKEVTGQEQAKIYLTFTFADDQKVDLTYPYADTLSTNLLAITKDAATQKNWAFEAKDYGEMGSLVTKIGEQTNGINQKYWQFFVNGEQPMVSADKFVPKTGDKIEWRFAESKF